MAGLRKIKGSWYARVHMPKGMRPSEKKVPLKTADEKIARIRRLEVNRYEKDLKAGIPISFPWLNDAGEVRVVRLSLKDAIAKYKKAREADSLKPKTIGIYDDAFNHLKKVLRPSMPVEDITTDHMDRFKQSCKKSHSVTTLQIRLRVYRTFFTWLKDRELIEKIPIIKSVNQVVSEPKYLSNKQFNAICKKVDPYLQSVFHFYRDTGCRLREPFIGTLNGEFLTIAAESAKGKRGRDIHLNQSQIHILIEMQSKTHLFKAISKVKDGRKNPTRSTNTPEYFSREFKQAAKDVKIYDRHFHHLRHTAAVRHYLKTRDIYAVAQLLGHSSVIVTEKYAKFDLRRLSQDFPDLVSQPYVIQPIKRFGT